MVARSSFPDLRSVMFYLCKSQYYNILLDEIGEYGQHIFTLSVFLSTFLFLSLLSPSHSPSLSLSHIPPSLSLTFSLLLSLCQVWDISTQHCIQTIVGHRCEIWSLVVHHSTKSSKDRDADGTSGRVHYSVCVRVL